MICGEWESNYKKIYPGIKDRRACIPRTNLYWTSDPSTTRYEGSVYFSAFQLHAEEDRKGFAVKIVWFEMFHMLPEGA